jgi:hypothetical protein
VDKVSRAEVAQIRQETQYTCCAASIASALKAHGKDVTEADVNRVMGAIPMGGATWEMMLATVQYFGMRGHLVVPATIAMLKEWTDAGKPVLIAWNPEGRPWSHASVVFDVDDQNNVYVMDSNIPNPTKTTRVVPEDEFYAKWSEKISDSVIVRRPAMMIDREVTTQGRQVMASHINWREYNLGTHRGERLRGYTFNDDDMKVDIEPVFEYTTVQDRDIPPLEDFRDPELYADNIPDLVEDARRIEREYSQWVRQGWWPRKVEVPKWAVDVLIKSDRKRFEARFDTLAEAKRQIESVIPKLKVRRRPSWLTPKVAAKEAPKQRNVEVQNMIDRSQKAGPHHTRERDVSKGQSRKPKHKKDIRREMEASLLLAWGSLTGEK